jgi:glycosyltransferase involved in cell wall biosynthesis
MPAIQAFSKMGAPPSRLVNFPYCVDVEKFAPYPGRRESERLVFGSCCRLHESKGIEMALRALKRLAQAEITSFLYRIAGDGPERHKLEDLAKELGLGRYVEFCGWVPANQLPAYYRSLDVFVHTASFEPYGVVVLEALSSGLPILASTKTMAAVDRVRDGRNGFLHQAGDELDLYRTMERFARLSLDERDQMAREARWAALDWTVVHAKGVINRLMTEVTMGEL